MLSKSSLRQRAAGTSATVASAEVLLSDIGSYLLSFTSRPVIIPKWEADREKSMLQTRNNLNYTLSASGHRRLSLRGRRQLIPVLCRLREDLACRVPPCSICPLSSRLVRQRVAALNRV